MQISKETERRFVLGRQGLWPGRRWNGRRGIRTAIRECRRIQIDPLDVIGRSHDIALRSRLVGYRPEDLEFLLYKQRSVFEYGGNLNIFPRDTLPLLWSWAHHQGIHPSWEKWARKNQPAIADALKEIDRFGPRESRHWKSGAREEKSWGGRTEGLALEYLWDRFEIMIHHREGNRKFYERTERLFGSLPDPLPEREAEDRMALETMTWLGLTSSFGMPYLSTYAKGWDKPPARRRIRQRLIDDGRLAQVGLEGEREPAVLPIEGLPLLEEVAAGGIPKPWKPATDELEAVLLAPLEVVSARSRAKSLFGFEHTWEVYTPAAKRRWGYYVVPVLLGDRLIGRVEPKFDPIRHELRIARGWWEAGVDLRDVTEPFALGLQRTLRDLGGRKVRLGRVGPSGFKSALESRLRKQPN